MSAGLPPRRRLFGRVTGLEIERRRVRKTLNSGADCGAYNPDGITRARSLSRREAALTEAVKLTAMVKAAG
jgi:hypothetical protein